MEGGGTRLRQTVTCRSFSLHNSAPRPMASKYTNDLATEEALGPQSRTQQVILFPGAGRTRGLDVEVRRLPEHRFGWSIRRRVPANPEYRSN